MMDNENISNVLTDLAAVDVEDLTPNLIRLAATIVATLDGKEHGAGWNGRGLLDEAERREYEQAERERMVDRLVHAMDSGAGRPDQSELRQYALRILSDETMSVEFVGTTSEVGATSEAEHPYESVRDESRRHRFDQASRVGQR